MPACSSTLKAMESIQEALTSKCCQLGLEGRSRMHSSEAICFKRWNSMGHEIEPWFPKEGAHSKWQKWKKQINEIPEGLGWPAAVLAASRSECSSPTESCASLLDWQQPWSPPIPATSQMTQYRYVLVLPLCFTVGRQGEDVHILDTLGL